jgi:hypothetical protein
MSSGGRKTKEGLIYWLTVGALFLLFLLPAAPLFLRLFVPFPSLSDSRHFVGTIQVRVEQSAGGRKWSQVHVLTESGKAEIKCGYWGARHLCFDIGRIDGARGEVWDHPAFGVVQWQLIHPISGEVFDLPHAAMKESHEKRFDYERFAWRLFWSIVLVVALVLYGRWRR